MNANRPATFSWLTLVQGHEPKASDLLRFLKIQAVLDYSELEPGLKASDAIRKAAADLKLDSTYQARLRLTGPVPMNDDEFATIKENAALNAALTIAVVLFILWMALRWWRIIVAVFLSLVGRTFRHRGARHAAGRRAQLDFGLFCRAVRRSRRRFRNSVQRPLSGGAARSRRSARGAAARRPARRRTADACGTGDGGGLSRVPADGIQGLSELGLIAGFGMLIAFLTSITLLPALLSQFKPRSEPNPLGYAFLAPVDEFLERHRIPILIVTALVILGGSPLLFWLRFDFNPMNLRNPNVESVATYIQLEKDGNGGSNNIAALEPSLAAADEVAAKLRALPQVARVTTLSTFIPDQQQEKLPLIQAAAEALDPALNPPKMSTSADRRGKRRRDQFHGRGARQACRRRGRSRRVMPPSACPPGLRRSPRPIRRCASAPRRAFVQPLQTALDDLRNLLKAHEVTRENLPPDLVDQWVTPDGQARLRSRAERRCQRQHDVAGVRARRAEPSSRTRPKGRFRFSRRARQSSPPSSKPAPSR